MGEYIHVPIFEDFTDDWNEAKRRVVTKLKTKDELNTVRFKGRRRHAFIKSMICKALRDNGHHFLTEAEMPNGKVADIYDASRDVVIEVETAASEADRESKMEDFGRMVSDLYIVNPREWPESFIEVYDRAVEELAL